jgi:AhpC/TSA family.
MQLRLGIICPWGKYSRFRGSLWALSSGPKETPLFKFGLLGALIAGHKNKYLQQLRQKFPAEQLNIVTISIDRSVEPVKDYMERNQYTFPVVMMTPELSKAIGRSGGVPELYVVNPQGRVIQKDFGLMVDLDLIDLARYAKNK